MEKLTNVLAKKALHFHIISPKSTASDALNKMCCENVDHLIVMENDRFMGVLTEHDIASKGMASSHPLNYWHVGDIMSKGLPVATADDTVERCMKLMRQHNVRYVPVFEDFNFIGVISSDDIIDQAVFIRGRIFDRENEENAVA